MKKLILTTFFLVFNLTAQSQSWWGSKKVKGNGNVITKTRSVGNFDEVNVGGSFNVTLIDGKEGNITIEGEENLLPYIVTEVRGGDLKIKFKNNINIRTTKKLLVTIPFEEIEGVSIGGSGNVKVEKTIKAKNASFNIGGSGNVKVEKTIKAKNASFNIGGSGNITTKLDANNVKTSIGGSGNINLAGFADNLNCSIGGSGNITAYDLETNTLKAVIAGSGDIKASVKNNISATVVGSGSIYYKGTPEKVDLNSLGSGKIINKN